MSNSTDETGGSSRRRRRPTGDPDRFRREKAIALSALKEYNPDAKKINIFECIPSFSGGVICLVEFKHNDNSDESEEWQILVRGGRGIVYHDYSYALREAASWRSTYDKIISSESIIAILSFVIIIAGIWMIYNDHHDDKIASILTVVIGFWFGRQTKPAQNIS